MQKNEEWTGRIESRDIQDQILRSSLSQQIKKISIKKIMETFVRQHDLRIFEAGDRPFS